MAEKKIAIAKMISDEQVNCPGYLIEDFIIMTRQDAIERMAKARYAQRPCYDKHGNEISFEEAKKDYQLFYKDLINEVEPLLNALLEGK